MDLLQIKTAVAAYHSMPQGDAVNVADLTVNGVDLFLVAANMAKQTASQMHDFGFERQLLTMTVNSATGGSLASAVILGTTTSATVKTVLDVGAFDTAGNYIPVEWTTAEESEGRQREENRYPHPRYRYPTDAQYHSHLWGERRMTFRGDKLMLWPLCMTNPQDIKVGIDCYVTEADWTSNDYGVTYGDAGPPPGVTPSTPTSDIWTTTGAQYILWQTICDLNKYFKTFVPRQEGNVTEPQERATTALQAFIDWDVFKFEQSRTHGR